ncbi:MJ0042-type zinc finger domain-containing protein [Reyranella sp.]|uniref:MJ0042-type zinc finger domain-containing protein n=1 Tax=Reyranella sp. TaxID=1929291 RepID=UPI003783A1AE
MHVTCSNCGARYIVDPLAIGPTGRTVQCARCNHRWFERAGPAPAAVLRERLEQPEPEPQAAAARSQGQTQGQDQSQPTYRSGLPAIARPPARRPRWPYWIAAAVLVAVALGAVLVFRGDTGAKSPMPWRATGLSLDGLSPAPAPPARLATADARRTGPPGAGLPRTVRVDSAPAIE